MMQTQDTNATITSLVKLEAEPNGVYKRWEDEITFAEKEMEKFWKSARLTIRRYIDDRDATEVQRRWYNVFFTNVGIMEASLYDQTPEATVSRRFLDMNDDVARVAGNILERCINQDMDEADCDFDSVMRHAVWDRLVPGLGAAWLRLETELEDIPDAIDPETEKPMQRIAFQEVAIDWVFFEDFMYSPCRVWEERRWVARKVYMTRDQLTKRFGEEKGKKVPLNTQSNKNSNLPNGNTPSNMVLKRGCVYEIWDREARKVIWFAKGMDTILEERGDFLHLRNGRFEPCPKPLFANLTTSNCLPKPDFAMLQDQYNELDEVNNRISLLIIACKVVGVYDRGADGVQRMLQEGYDNTLIPVDNWAMFAEKGGLKGQIDFLPIDTVVGALNQLQGHRAELKAQIDALTGISDIVRGNTKASETLGAQELKAKYASTMIQKRQQDVTRFAEEMLQIKADIICQHFDPQQILKLANVANMAQEDQMLVQQAMALVTGEEEELCWRVDIQATSMAITDYAAVKNERSEFLNSVATFLQSASTVGQGAPQLVPLMLKMLQFGVAGFRVSKDIEGIFDKYVGDFEQEIEQKKNAPPPPDPEMQKMQMEAQLEQQKAQSELQMKQQEFQMEMQQKQAEFAQQMRQDQQEFALKLQQIVMEGEIKQKIAIQDSAINAEMMAMEHQKKMERIDNNQGES
jgi:hypothetical protein